jgi:hypothetical protein
MRVRAGEDAAKHLRVVVFVANNQASRMAFNVARVRSWGKG